MKKFGLKILGAVVVTAVVATLFMLAGWGVSWVVGIPFWQGVVAWVLAWVLALTASGHGTS